MKKNLKEAAVTLDIAGLESSDLQALSELLALAGRAEQQSTPGAGMGAGPLAPMDFDSIGGDETQPIMDPSSAMSVDSPADGAGDLAAAVDDLAGTVTDFGADSEVEDGLGGDEMSMDVGMDVEPEGEDDLGLDMSGLPTVESLSGDEEFLKDVEEEDDIVENFSLRGLMSSVASIFESEDEEDEDAEKVDESLLPDLSLGLEEDAGDDTSDGHGPYRSEAGARDDAERAVGGDFIIIPSRDGYYWKHQEADISSAHGPYQSEAGARDDAEQAVGLDFVIYKRRDGYYWDKNAEYMGESRRDFGDTEHVVDSKEHGPFRSHNAAVHDAMKQTNGTEYEHFVVIPGADGFYWRRNLEEDLDNEPDLHQYNNDGIENSRHAFEPKRPGTALGDNPLGESVDDDEEVEIDDEEEDDSVEDIYESLQKKYNQFVGK